MGLSGTAVSWCWSAACPLRAWFSLDFTPRTPSSTTGAYGGGDRGTLACRTLPLDLRRRPNGSRGCPTSQRSPAGGISCVRDFETTRSCVEVATTRASSATPRRLPESSRRRWSSGRPERGLPLSPFAVAQEAAHALELSIELAVELRVARAPVQESELTIELAPFHREVCPGDDFIAP